MLSQCIAESLVLVIGHCVIGELLSASVSYFGVDCFSFNTRFRAAIKLTPKCTLSRLLHHVKSSRLVVNCLFLNKPRGETHDKIHDLGIFGSPLP